MNMVTGKEDSARVHADEQRRLGESTKAGLPPRDDPQAQGRFDNAEQKKKTARLAGTHEGHRFDDLELARTAPEQLAPNAFVEPYGGDSASNQR